MIKPKRIVFTLLLLVAVPAGCSNPCAELAEMVCQKVGGATRECEDTRDRAENPSREERKACEVALELARELIQR